MAKGHLGRSVSIIGVGLSPVGNVLEHPEIKGCMQGELLSAATTEALNDAGITAKDVDAFYCGMLCPGIEDKMGGHAGHMAHWMGMKNKPGLGHDECCATGLHGMQQAAMAVASGMYDIVISAGTCAASLEYPTNGSPAHLAIPKNPAQKMAETCYMVQDMYYAAPGRGLLNPLDDWAVAYAKKYGVSREDMFRVMNQVCITSREHACLNPKALMATETYEDEAKRMGFDNAMEYLGSDIFNPAFDSLVHLKHNGPPADGAAVQIICATDIAKKICKHPIEIAGFGSTSGWDSDCGDMPIGPDYLAYKRAYAMAGITDPYKEVDHLAVHDCTASNWMYFGEDGGYFKPGEAWKAILDGRCRFDGDKPMCTSGGRMGLGHPEGAANGVEIYEAVKQMRGLCGDRQMPKPPKTAVIQSVGGSWHFAVSVLRML